MAFRASLQTRRLFKNTLIRRNAIQKTSFSSTRILADEKGTEKVAENVSTSSRNPLGLTNKGPMYSRANLKATGDYHDTTFDIEKLEPWKGDDHHIFGHWLLNAYKDVRKYVRKEKYEIPLLKAKAKKFVVPSAEQFVMYQINTVHGSPNDPHNRRVTLKLKVSKLELKKPEWHKFLLLVGPRYNHNTGMLTMSSESELTPLLNKKKLSDTLDSLVKEAKDSKDTFEDIPLTFYKPKKPVKPKFPKEWLPKLRTRVRAVTKSGVRATVKPGARSRARTSAA